MIELEALRKVAEAAQRWLDYEHHAVRREHMRERLIEALAALQEAEAPKDWVEVTLQNGHTERAAIVAEGDARASLIKNLAVLVARLAARVARSNPGDKVAAQAVDFLRRNDLIGSPLRGEIARGDHAQPEPAQREGEG